MRVLCDGKVAYDQDTSPPSAYFEAVITLLNTTIAVVDGAPRGWDYVIAVLPAKTALTYRLEGHS